MIGRGSVNHSDENLPRRRRGAKYRREYNKKRPDPRPLSFHVYSLVQVGFESCCHSFYRRHNNKKSLRTSAPPRLRGKRSSSALSTCSSHFPPCALPFAKSPALMMFILSGVMCFFIAALTCSGVSAITFLKERAAACVVLVVL